MNIKPLFNNVVIKPDPENAPSKIIIPETHKKFANRGTVVAVGPGERLLGSTDCAPIPVKPGDKVMFGKLRAFPFTHDGENYVNVEARDILHILE